MKNKKTNYLITGTVILSCLFVLGLGGYYLRKQNQPPPSPVTATADTVDNWKTYTASDNTFSFRFPDQWSAQPNQVFGSRSVTEFQFQNNPLFTVTLLGNYNQITGQPFKTLEEYLGVRNAKSKGFLLDGVQAKRVTDPGEAGHVLPYEEVVAFSKDSKFIVSLYFEPDYYPQVKENKTFDQILSSFKFLNIIDTSSWKTYTNNDFGISFLYPADLYTPVAAKTFPSPINPKKFTDDLKTVPIISVTSNHPVGVDDQGPIMIQKLSNTTIDSWLGTNETAEKATTGSYFPVSGHVINKTTFQGLTAYLLKEKTNAQVPEDKYLVQAGKDVYYISFASDPPVLTDSSSQQYYANFDKNTKPIIEEVLASMKFLSKT